MRLLRERDMNGLVHSVHSSEDVSAQIARYALYCCSRLSPGQWWFDQVSEETVASFVSAWRGLSST